MSERPIFEYGAGELCRFWRLHGERLCRQMDIPGPEMDVSPKHMRKLITRELKDEPFEYVCDVLWWINLNWFCASGYELLEGDYQWIFNTPEHPFEQFLAGELRILGKDPYECFATKFPIVQM